MKKSLKRKINKFFHRYINGTKGVISLFLAILMVPFATISGALINAARFNSAVEIFDEALCNASNSTLGTYDEFLRDRFGLLAMYQNVASGESGYDAQALISDTFKYYMEQNLKTLSNTYETSEVEAHGIYPLADTDILLSQIYESGKYTVPTKMIIDGLSIEDIINKLTESTNIVSNIFNTMTSGADMIDGFDTCQEKINGLVNQIQATRTAKSEYDTSYSNFKNAVDNYNKTVDDMNNEIQSVQNEIDKADEKVKNCKENLENEEKKDQVSLLLQQIKELENQKDADGNFIDNSDKIKKLEEENKDVLKDYNKAKKDLDDAKNELDEAEGKAGGIKDKYRDQLNNQKNQVRTQKNDYLNKIDSYAQNVLNTGNAVAAAQSSVAQLERTGSDFADNFATNVFDIQGKVVDNKLEDLKKSKDSALKREEDGEESGAVDEIDKDIAKYDQDKANLDSGNNIKSSFINGAKEGTTALANFATDDYNSTYQSLYFQIINLKNRVNGYVIPDDDIKMEDASLYYLNNLSEPVTLEKVQELGNNFAKELMAPEQKFFSVIKAITSFIKGMFKFEWLFNVELTATINKGLYSELGGLPSEKDRSEGSRYSLKSEYEDADSEKSDYYKSLLGEYSNNPGVAGNVNENVDMINQILTDVDTIISCVSEEWHWNNVWEKLKSISGAIFDIVGKMISFVGEMVQTMLTSISQKALLVGYIGYNIPNRTTFKTSALTGASYSLPSISSSKQGYAFYGAEAEYIMNGDTSEIENQVKVFWQSYLFRFIYDIAFVATNPEVTAIAGAAGAPTFGIGAVIVYVLYFLAEPFVDTWVLVNGGKVPIVKTKLFLTPTGLPDLLGRLTTISLTNEQKNEIYKEACNVVNTGSTTSTFPEDYETAKNMASHGKIIDSISFDYTKTIMIVMMLLKKSDTMLDRLSDVIEMEAMYHAKTQIDSYTFDLDKSYTYLRASGKFSSNEFIKISDSPSLLSPERIVYRGY